MTINRTEAKELASLVQRAEHALSMERRRRYAEIGLTHAQATILLVLSEHGPMTLNELSAHLVSETPPSRLVSVLVNKKLIHRRDQASDRRHLEISLSSKGISFIPIIRRTDNDFFSWVAKRLSEISTKQTALALRSLTIVDDEV